MNEIEIKFAVLRLIALQQYMLDNPINTTLSSRRMKDRQKHVFEEIQTITKQLIEVVPD